MHLRIGSSLSWSKLVMVVALTACSCDVGYGEDVVAEGAISELTDEIGSLLHLTWRDDRLAVDRDHWFKATGEKTEEDIEKERLDGMLKRGIPEELAKKMLERQGDLFGPGNFLTNSPEGELFEGLKIASNANSGGGGGSGEDMHWTGRGPDMALAMWRSPDDFRISIRETGQPFHELIVEDHHKKGLSIIFRADGRTMLFAQSNDGKVAVAHTCASRNDAFKAGSYEDMIASYPEFTADFADMLKGVGVNVPLSRFDSRVTDAVAAMLRKPDGDVQTEAQKVIARLSSESYETRMAAHREVQKNVIPWRNVIEQMLADEDLHVETRNRLTAIHLEAGFESTEVEAYVKERRLLEDAEYLKELQPRVTDSIQSLIVERLEELESAP